MNDDYLYGDNNKEHCVQGKPNHFCITTVGNYTRFYRGWRERGRGEGRGRWREEEEEEEEEGRRNRARQMERGNRVRGAEKGGERARQRELGHAP